MSQHPDYGTIEDYVSCQIEGTPLEISFNGKFILDILKHCHDDEVILKSRENSPMLVQDKEDLSCTFVVTPMRTK
jgi:DNA polymerase-3 subunit beta